MLKSEARTDDASVMAAEEWALVGWKRSMLFNRNKDYE